MKRMYCYMHGIVEVYDSNPEGGAEIDGYPLRYQPVDRDMMSVTRNGRHWNDDKYPLLISLERAEKQGLVKRVVKSKRVKYSDLYGRVNITGAHYASKSEFYMHNGGFISFVDENGHMCPPPNETVVEWEEVPQDEEELYV